MGFPCCRTPLNQLSPVDQRAQGVLALVSSEDVTEILTKQAGLGTGIDTSDFVDPFVHIAAEEVI